MTGSEKQIKYATDLINDFEAKVNKIVSRGKADKIQDRIEILEFVKTIDDAHIVIEVLNNWSTFGDDPVNGERGIKAYFNL